MLGGARFGHVTLEIRRFYAVGYRVQVFERGAEASQDVAERVGGRPVGFGPPRGQLHAGDGIVCAADPNTLAAPIAVVAVWALVATTAANGALTCAHVVQL